MNTKIDLKIDFGLHLGMNATGDIMFLYLFLIIYQSPLTIDDNFWTQLANSSHIAYIYCRIDQKATSNLRLLYIV